LPGGPCAKLLGWLAGSECRAPAQRSTCSIGLAFENAPFEVLGSPRSSTVNFGPRTVTDTPPPSQGATRAAGSFKDREYRDLNSNPGCHHNAELDVRRLRDDVISNDLQPRMFCTVCAIIAAPMSARHGCIMADWSRRSRTAIAFSSESLPRT
jgi:hypothetical protein